MGHDCEFFLADLADGRASSHQYDSTHAPQTMSAYLGACQKATISASGKRTASQNPGRLLCGDISSAAETVAF